MYYSIICDDVIDSLERRKSVRTAHLERLDNLANQNINVGMFSKNIVRLVAHLDITDEDLDILFKSLTKF